MKSNYFNRTKTGLKALMLGLFLFGAIITKAQCPASFTYALGPNGSVSFSSTSQGTTVSTFYSWNFGGGASAWGATSAHTYSTNGYKYVCLSVVANTTSPGSCTSTVCDSILITNITPTTTPCAASFSYTTGPNGAVNFMNTSTGTSVTTNYNWSFGSSVYASGVSPSHTYTSNGLKLVCLTISDSLSGCNSTICNSLTISNVTPSTSPCSANFNYVLGANGSVNFVSTSTGTSPTTYYYWNFGNSAFGSGIAPNHVYTSNGLKVVCLTITDSISNCSSSICDSLLITNVTPSTTPCNAGFSYVTGANGSVNFASTSTGTSVSTNYSWNFGGSASGSGTAPSHTFTSNGIKWVCLTITNSVTTCSSTFCDSLLITNVGGSVTPCNPSVMYTLTKDSTLALTWNAYPAYPANITNATWYWGDGTSTTGLYPSHTYSSAGTYSTCVTVSVSCGTVTATYCYVAGIFRSSENNDMILVNVKQALATGLKEQAATNTWLSVFPNPVSEAVNIELHAPANASKVSTVYVYNTMGQKVIEKQITTDGTYTLDVSELSEGTYFIHVNSGGMLLHKKISVLK